VSNVKEWLLQSASLAASDVHLVAGYPPTRRENGELVSMSSEKLSSEEVERALKSICTPSDYETFVRERNVDFAFTLTESTLDGRAGGNVCQRFRANFFFNEESPGACIRVIPSVIPDLESNHFPVDLCDKITSFRNGLVIFSGVTGSGKTTSMAMVLERLAKQGGKRVVTIEDPVEFMFPTIGTSVITQREVGRDVRCFASGLKYALRQDPDIILVGEIRDLETAKMALSAAETGHLVLTTLHSRDAKGAISRLVDLFPSNTQYEIFAMLAAGLRAVVCQHLLPNAIPGERRELALEVLLRSQGVASGLRTGRIDNLDNAILAGRKDGMVVLDESLGELLRQGRITESTALQYASDTQLLGR
jgi:twitching motility protein PilT